jgi:hypothetical protein
MRELQELSELVARYVEDEKIPAWMDSASDAFGGLTPRELIRDGRMRDLTLEFRRLQSGEPL